MKKQQKIRVVLVTTAFLMVAVCIYIHNLLHAVSTIQQGQTEHDQQQRAAIHHHHHHHHHVQKRQWTRRKTIREVVSDKEKNESEGGAHVIRTTSSSSSIHALDMTENNTTTTISSNSTALVCLEPECLDKIARSMARAFPDRPRDSWCIPAASSSSSSSIQDWGSNSYIEESGLWQGILLLKVPKAASSTSAGLALRIAHRYNCTAVQWLHRKGHLYADKRIKNSTFLFAPVRNAASRAISAAWYFDISHWNLAGTDKDVIEAMKNGMENKARLGRGGIQYSWMSLESNKVSRHFVWRKEEPETVQKAELVHEKLIAMMQEYNFLIVSKRMDESLTAMALIMGLDDMGDVVLPSSSKVSSGRDYSLIGGGKERGKCFKRRTVVQQFAQSRTWLVMNYAGEILWRAANYSLDLTFERLGRERFETALAQLQRLEEQVSSVCNVGRGANG